MSAPLSNELFFEAHRGIQDKLDPKYGVGMHFSAEHSVARRFAFQNTNSPGTIVHARIPISSVESDPKVLGQRGYDKDNKFAESEIPVKQGAPILVTGITKYSAPKRTLDNLSRRDRYRRYNPPREMRA